MTKRFLPENDLHYQVLVEDLNEIIYRLDDKATVTYISPSIESISGYRPDEIIGRNFIELVHPEDQNGRIEQYHKIMAGISEPSEYRFIDKQGNAVWITTCARPVIENDKVVGIQGVLTNITARKLAEEELMRQKWRLQAIIDGTNVGTWEWNVQTGKTVFNSTWARIIGYTLEELSPVTIDTWKALVHPRDLEKSRKLLERHFSKELPHYDCECRIRHKDGHWIVVHDRGKVVTWTPEGEPLMMFGTHQDITEQKEAQGRIIQLQKAESLDRMAGAIAHHYNNLLTIVQGSLEIALTALPDNSRLKQTLSRAMRATRRAVKMGAMMLAYLGQEITEHDLLNLSSVCRDYLFDLKADIPTDVVLESSFLNPGPEIMANAEQIRQILEILVVNAWESIGDKKGTVSVIVSRVPSGSIFLVHSYPVDFEPVNSGYACLEVNDTGCGIVEGDLEKIFDPFYSTKFTGRGLGLSIALGAIKAHSGCITVTTRPGRGSSFKVFIPTRR